MNTASKVLCVLLLSAMTALSNVPSSAQEPRLLTSLPGNFGPRGGALQWAPGTPLGEGGLLAVAEPGGSIALWNGRESRKIKSLEGLSGAAQVLAFSSDGTLLAAASWQRFPADSPEAQTEAGKNGAGKTNVVIWNVVSGAKVSEFSGPNSGVSRLAWWPDDKTLALAGALYEGEVGLKRTGNSYNAVLQLWDAKTGVMKTQSDGNVLAFAPDGKRVARLGGHVIAKTSGASPQMTVVIENLDDKSKVVTEGGHSYEIGNAQFSPDGAILATRGNGGIKLWDSMTGKLRNDLQSGSEGSVSQGVIAFDARSTRVADLGFGSTLFDLSSGDFIGQIPPLKEMRNGSGSYRASLSPSGKLLAVLVPADKNEHRLYLYDLATLAAPGQPSSRDPKDTPDLWTLRPGANALAWASQSTLVTVGAQLNLWNTTKHTRLRSRPGTDYATSVAVSNDSKTGLTGGTGSNSVRLWNLNTATMTRILGQHEWPINAVALSPDGKIAAAGGSGFTGSTRTASLGLISLWNTATGERLKTLTRTSNRPTALTFSPDGQWLINGCTDGGVDFWRVSETLKNPDPDGGSPLQTFISQQSGFDNAATIKSVAWRQGLVWAAQSEGTIRIYKLEAGVWKESRQIRLRPGSMIERNAIGAFALSPDAKTFATSVENGYEGPATVSLHSAVDGKILKKLDLPRRAQDLLFAPDGKSLAIAVADGTLKLWSVQP
jgi:WD40 repeat protein